MQDLRTYINEAISSRANSAMVGGYTQFPNKRGEKETIINWLEQNGFENVKTNVNPTTDSGAAGDGLLAHYNHTGNKCFTLGRYDKDLFNTNYILFYDSQKMFLIFTCPAMYLNAKQEPVSSLNNPTKGNCDFGNFRYCSVKEIQRYFNS